jgi:hypothetical protein
LVKSAIRDLQLRAMQAVFQTSGGTVFASRGVAMRRINPVMRILLLAAVGLAAAPGANAAPFCVQSGAVPPQCLYFDAASCDARARQMNGSCTTNPAELRVSPGPGHFCLITSGPVSSCLYFDGASCDVEAKRQHGVCIEQPARSESPPPDPYRQIRPLTAGGGARE